MTADTPEPWAERPAHLQRFVDKRDGRVRVYLRRPGDCRKYPLAAAWGSQALADEVATLIAANPLAPARPAPRTGTLVGAIDDYRGGHGKNPSADFLMLAPSTQKEYERVLDEMERVFAGVLLADVDAAYALDLRNGWAKKGYRAANLRLQVLKNVCKAPIIVKAIPENPFLLIEPVARPQELGVANPAWEDWETEAAIALALEQKKPGLARAIALGRWGGFRKQSIRSVPQRARIVRPNSAGAEERRLYWVTEKRLVLCDRKEDPRLTALLAETPNRALTIAYDSDGGPWKSRALGHAVERLLERLAGKVRPGLTIHGLRHARGVELAVAGCSDAQIMAQLDHATPRQAALYRKQAERRGLADSGQAQVDAQITRLADARKKRGQSAAP